MVARSLACPFLRCEVELSSERKAHIAAGHPELWPGGYELVAGCLRDPDSVVRSKHEPNVLIFYRRYDLRARTRHVAVVLAAHERVARPWVVTAFTTRRRSKGDVLWQRS